MVVLAMESHSQTCKISGCDRASKNAGMCWGHYSRNRKHGNPLAGRTAEGVPMQFLRDAVASESTFCIEWKYSLSGSGRPLVWHKGRMAQAARVALEMACGPPPSDKHLALHSPVECHNTLCVNPRHLRWGTPADNNADMFLDGTACIGQRNAQCKLSDEEVRFIRSSSDQSADLAQRFGVSQRTVRGIRACHVRNQPWI
jgi:hypothetical protein